MDRTRRRSGLLIAVTGLALSAAAPISPPLKALRWLAPAGDRVRALTTAPSECLRRPVDPAEAARVEIGRAAFRTPLLLGGQAARAGVACETCHTNGRRNGNFDFPGVSGAPGTADVTASLFSSHRGDDVFDPRAIPDLGGAKSSLKVSQSRDTHALEGFIHGLVTEEFDGPEPPPAVLSGLAAYVRALDPSGCAAPGAAPVRVDAAIADARRAIRTAINAPDAATARLMIQAGRAQLGAISERYAGPDLVAERSALAVADLDLASVLAASRAGANDIDRRLSGWLARSTDWARRLERTEARSLYNPRQLALALARSAS